MSTPEQLHQFYGPEWNTRDTDLDQYEYSGYNLGEVVRAGERVLHVNCGNNPFRGMIPNFQGIDPVDTNADLVTTLEEYVATHKTSRYNVAFCLDAFTGTEEYIRSQIALLMQKMHKRDIRIYWRTTTVGAYPWTFEMHNRLAEQFDYHVLEAVHDANDTIFAEWNSNNIGLGQS
jgi:hypothetical protein